MNTLIALAYLLAAALFILGLKQLSSPKGARNGNFTAAAGMVIALGATVPLLHFTQVGLEITAVGLVIGTLIGTVGARMVRMTAIPQMVALFNGVGGGAAALVAVAELLKFGVHPTRGRGERFHAEQLRADRRRHARRGVRFAPDQIDERRHGPLPRQRPVRSVRPGARRRHGRRLRRAGAKRPLGLGGGPGHA